jgi:PAS domain S-box-containing protein
MVPITPSANPERLGGLHAPEGPVPETSPDRHVSLILFRHLIDRSNDALEILDSATLRFVDVNERACHDLGRSRDELLSLTIRDIDPFVNQIAEDLAKQFAETGLITFESHHRRKDGSLFPVEVSVKRVAVDGACYDVCGVRDISERRRTQQSLFEREERLRLAVAEGQMFAYTWDASTDEIVRTGESRRILGIDASMPQSGRQAMAWIHPEDQQQVTAAHAALSAAHPQLKLTHRLIRPDGSMVWVECLSRAHFDDCGTLTRVVGMVVDVTPYKMAEHTLSNIGRRLLEVQEAERARIARDLHDDIAQRLTVLLLMLDHLKTPPSEASDQRADEIDAVMQHTQEICRDVQALARDLHAAKLHMLGLVRTTQAFCRDLGAQHHVQVDFSHESVPPTVAPDVALCVFRVAQEALRNAVQHSTARHITVTLRGSADTLQLSVQDAGRGFDPDVVARGEGLGLTSMQERMKLVGGQLSIASRVAQGTTIVASVPLRSQPRPLASEPSSAVAS